MKTFLIALILLGLLLTVAALIRGIVIFLRTKQEELTTGTGPSVSGLAQNKAMRSRILWQAVTVLLAACLLLLSRSG